MLLFFLRISTPLVRINPLSDSTSTSFLPILFSPLSLPIHLLSMTSQNPLRSRGQVQIRSGRVIRSVCLCPFPSVHFLSNSVFLFFLSPSSLIFLSYFCYFSFAFFSLPYFSNISNLWFSHFYNFLPILFFYLFCVF